MKPLEEMSLEELWQLFPVVLSAPDIRRIEMAEREIARLLKRLGSYRIRINHIGSTAIRGIWAKPIIDLLVEAEKPERLDTLEPEIIDAGYIRMNRSETRIDFNKGYTPEGYADEVFHLHLRNAGDNDEILFRDYLNAHPETAKEYERLKMKLAERFRHDRDAYTDAKSGFVNYYTGIAKLKNVKYITI